MAYPFGEARPGRSGLAHLTGRSHRAPHAGGMISPMPILTSTAGPSAREGPNPTAPDGARSNGGAAAPAAPLAAGARRPRSPCGAGRTATRRWPTSGAAPGAGLLRRRLAPGLHGAARAPPRRLPRGGATRRWGGGDLRRHPLVPRGLRARPRAAVPAARRRSPPGGSGAGVRRLRRRRRTAPGGRLFVVDARGAVAWSAAFPEGLDPGVDGLLTALEALPPRSGRRRG